MKKFLVAFGFGICILLFGGAFLLAVLCIVRTFREIAVLTAWKAVVAFALASAMAALWILGVAIYGASLLELRDFYRKKNKEEEDGAD